MKEATSNLREMKYRVANAELNCSNLQEENEILKTKLDEVTSAKKNLEEKVATNKEIELYSKMETADEEYNLTETINEFLKKPDGITSLKTFIFVLQEKVRNLQEENKESKKYF